MTGLLIDLFAGGGGASTGIEAALGRPVDVAINHSEIALAVHRANHPQTKHYPTDIWDVDPYLATAQVRLIGNSVPPEVVEEVVRANVPRGMEAAA